MTTANFTVTSKLMQDYVSGSAVDYQNAITAVSDSNGSLLFFSIGSDGHIYVSSPAPGSSTGWQRTDLSEGLQDGTAILLAAEQDEKGEPVLAAVMHSQSTDEYSAYVTEDFTDGSGAQRWVFRGKQKGAQVTGLATGHGKDGGLLIVLTAQQGDDSTSYLVNPDPTDTSWFWKEVPSPVNSERVISTAIGHSSQLEKIEEVQALLYSLQQLGNESWVVITSLPDFTFYNHVIPLDFQPTAMGITRDSLGNSELVVGDNTLYHLTPELQQEKDPAQVKQGIESITTEAASHNVQSIEVVRMSNDCLEVWYLLDDGSLNRCYQSNPPQWVSPLPFQSGVGEITAWRAQEGTVANVFCVDLDNRLTCCRQDLSTSLWRVFDIVEEALDSNEEVVAYSTQIQLTDENGAPMTGQQITLQASELTTLSVNGTTYYVDPAADPIVCTSDALGNVMIVNRVETLSAPLLQLEGAALGSQPITIDPTSDIRDRLSGISDDQLRGAVVQTDAIGVSQPLFSKEPEGLSDQNAALQALLTLTKGLPSGEIDLGAVPADHSWSLDFTGSQPVFAGEPGGSANAATTEGGGGASSTLSIAQGVVADVEHLFGDVWHAVENDLVPVERWIVQKGDNGINFLIATAEGEFSVLITRVEQAWSVVQRVFDQLGADIHALLGWLGSVFAWKDILRTHNVIRTVCDHAIDAFVGELAGAATWVENVFGEFSTRTTGVDLVGQLGTWAQKDFAALSTTGGNPSPLASPDTSWALQHITGGSVFENGDNTPTNVTVDLSDTVKSDVDAIKNLLDDAVADLTQHKITVADFFGRVLSALDEAALDTVKDATVAAAESLEAVVDAIRDVLNATWDVPVLSPIYAELTSSKLTLLDLVSLLAAIPTTALYKASAGAAPFTDATASQLSATTSMDDLLQIVGAQDQSQTGPASPASMSVSNAPSSAHGLEAAQESNVPAGAQATGYVFDFGAGIASLVNGLSNFALTVSSPTQLSAADKVKLVSGIIANALSYVSMAIVLHYAEEDSSSTEEDLERLRFEMFVTVYQALFSAKDALVVPVRDASGGIVDEIVLEVLDFLETALGAINLVWFGSLAITEGVEEGGDSDLGLKTTQNVASALSQILSLPGDLAKDPVTKGAIAVAQFVLGAAPGVLMCVRTGLDVRQGVPAVIR